MLWALLSERRTVTAAKLHAFFAARGVSLLDESEVERTGATLLGPHADKPLAMNTIKMFATLHAADALRRAAEAERGRPYRYVVRLRPDKKLVRFDLAQYADQIARTGGVSANNLLEGGYGYGDQFAFGSADAMTVYASLWDRLRAAGDIRALPGWRGGFAERLLFDHLWHERVGMQVAPRNPYGAMMNGPAPQAILDALLEEGARVPQDTARLGIINEAAATLRREIEAAANLGR